MDTQISTAAPAIRAPRRRRWPWYVMSFVGLLLIILIAGYAYLYWTGARETESALTETDRLDPDWRLADLEAKREVLRPEENSALQVTKVYGLARHNARTWNNDFTLQFEKLEAPYELNELQIQMLREARADMQEALVEAGKLKDMPKGRFPMKWSADWITTNLNDQQNARRAFELLQHDAWVRAQTGDLDGAVESCRACMNGARSLGDEPILISFLIRVAGDHGALQALERVLAQGRPSDTALAPMQALIEQEIIDVQKQWTNAMRGERGGQQHLMQAIADGKIGISRLGGLGGNAGLGDKVTDFFPAVMTHGYPSLLRHMNQVVEATKLPLEQQRDRLLELEKEIPRASILARLMAPAVQKVGNAHLRDQAMLRSALVAVAAERFRIKNERWPESPAELVKAGLIAEAPVDPYDGAALRWRRFPDGMAAYGVGIDKTDDGGNINNRSDEKGFDVGLKVWDLPRRRQPARLPVPDENALPPGR